VRVTEIQRARILAAMVDVIAEHGAANVTVAHIVARSGVSRRTFYELFGDREDCLLAALDDAVARASGYVLRSYDRGARWRERIRSGLVGLLEFLQDEPAMGRLLVVESLGAGPLALQRRSRALAHAITAVDEGRCESKTVKEPPPLTAEGIVGGVLSVLHARLLEHEPGSLLELTGPLMSMIVLPYQGATAAQRELERPLPEHHTPQHPGSTDPLRDLEMRLTYRTVRVLIAVAEHPGSSNRQVGISAGMQDQGQISKLLARLHRLGLIHNTPTTPSQGAPNAWTLTPKGTEVEQALGRQGATEHAH
jgi:AcrR family transcriptional regulator